MSDELRQAIEQRNRSAIMAQIASGMDVAYELYGAVRRNDISLVRLLIRCGAVVNARDITGRTALMWAACEGSVPMVKFLLANGAEPRAENNAGITALMFARQNPFERTYRGCRCVGGACFIHVDEERLRQNWASKTREWWTRRKTASLLVKAGGDCQERDPVKRRKGATIRLINSLPHPDDGPFGLFAQAREAVASGADVNATKGGKTLLTAAATVACVTGHDEFLRLLLKAGADVNARNEDGTTAAQCASQYRNPRAIRLLEQAGARK